jgi:hypothetical protein
VADLTGRIDHVVGQLTTRAAPGQPGPAGGPPAVELRPNDPAFADMVAGLLGMPLDQYARMGAPLEVRVPWLDVTLWFVPAGADADRLGGEGVGRGRIWTAAELSQLMALSGLTPAVVETLARAKLAVDGDIVEVRGR